MNAGEQVRPIRPLNADERTRFVDAVRDLLDPLTPSLLDVSDEPSTTSTELSVTLSNWANYQLPDIEVAVSEDQVASGDVPDSVTLRTTRTTPDEASGRALTTVQNYWVNPTDGYSGYAEWTRDTSAIQAPNPDNAGATEQSIAASITYSLAQIQADRAVGSLIFTPERLDEALDALTQCNPANRTA